MNVSLSLYDALVGVAVPAEAARAVVRALEQDMEAVNAVGRDLGLIRFNHEVLKQDGSALRQEVSVLKQDVAVLKQDVAVLKQDVAALKLDMVEVKQDIALLKQDVTVLKDDVADLKRRMTAVEVELVCLRKDLSAMEARLTLRLGSMLFLGMGLLFAALKLT